MGVSPDYFAQQLVQNNQINVAVTEVLRGKAATIVAERVAVTDEAGNAVDVKAQIEALNADVDAMLAAQAEAQQGAEGDIAVDDLSIDVAGTIEAEDEAEAEAAADAVVEAETIVEAEAVAEEVVAEAIEEDDAVAEAARTTTRPSQGFTARVARAVHCPGYARSCLCVRRSNLENRRFCRNCRISSPMRNQLSRNAVPQRCAESEQVGTADPVTPHWR